MPPTARHQGGKDLGGDRAAPTMRHFPLDEQWLGD